MTSVSKGCTGKGSQPGLFLREHVGDRPVPLFRMAPLMRDVVPPAAKLRVKVVEVAKRPGRKERVAEILDLALDLMVNRGRVAGSVPSPTWRVWLVGFVIAVVGVTAVSAAWHAEHDAGPSCVVCKLRHQPLAEVSGDLQVRPVDEPEPATPLSVTALVSANPDEQVPIRAPPLS